jgi:Ca-activated chloride channel homolog
MSSYRRPLWLYPIFQIPLILFGLCLITALLFWLLGFGKPKVAVAIALDISGSTYNNQIELFNRPGMIVNQEIEAVQAYLKQNNGEALRRPNQVKVFGFGGLVKPLTNNFSTDSKKVAQELDEALARPELAQEINPDQTDINAAIEASTNAVKVLGKECKEVIVVTDGQGVISPGAIANAVANRVKINAVVLGQEALVLRGAAIATRGTYLSGNSNDLSAFFTDDFFSLFNSNLKWRGFWLGMAWIALMWTLVLPLDRWIFQGWLNMTMDKSGKLAISWALFWTVTTLSAIWRFWGIPFLSGGC